jgi:hypothetical protein
MIRSVVAGAPGWPKVEVISTLWLSAMAATDACTTLTVCV